METPSKVWPFSSASVAVFIVSSGAVRPYTSPGARRPDGKARQRRILVIFD
jgi:hypothetical protein